MKDNPARVNPPDSPPYEPALSADETRARREAEAEQDVVMTKMTYDAYVEEFGDHHWLTDMAREDYEVACRVFERLQCEG